MKNIKKYAVRISVVFIIAFIVSLVVFLFKKQAEYTENRYYLEEIEIGIYARYYQTVSSILAHNYDVAEICVNGNVYTFKGTVNISYTSENPYVVVMQNNLVNDDKVYLYVPKGTVDYRESVGIR